MSLRRLSTPFSFPARLSLALESFYRTFFPDDATGAQPEASVEKRAGEELLSAELHPLECRPVDCVESRAVANRAGRVSKADDAEALRPPHLKLAAFGQAGRSRRDSPHAVGGGRFRRCRPSDTRRRRV